MSLYIQWILLALLGGIAFGFANFWLGETTIYSPFKAKLYMSYGILLWSVLYLVFIGIKFKRKYGSCF